MQSNFFYDRDHIGTPFEERVLTILQNRGLPCGTNPFSKTEDIRREWYDVWVYSEDGLWLECKKDKKSEIYQNVCVELHSLEVTKAGYFIYGFPTKDCLYIHAFETAELRKLVNQTILTFSGRIWRYKRVQTGDQATNISSLIPVSLTHKVGQPFGRLLEQLTIQQAA